jgi:hypothetical protein
MMKARKGNTAAGIQQDLESVMKQFDRWRGQKHEGERIPQHLWQAATSLYPQYSMNKIARSLRLDSGDLRDRIHLAGGKNLRSKSHEVPQFMPLAMTPTSNEGLADCHIKVKDGRKARLRIRLKGAGVQPLVEVLREIWSRSA